MLQSQLFGKTTKNPPADADSVNARFLTQGGFIQQQMAGVYNYLPLGLKVLSKIQAIIREEMQAAGAQEVLMPALTQVESWQTTKRQDMDVLFHLEGHNGAEYVLNPTHEEIVTPLVQKYVFSYRDLPVCVFQIQNKYRNEPRAKSGILRGREFNMKDAYSFHTTGDDLNTYYDKMITVYKAIYHRLGIGDRTLVTYASGGDFSKYSHEFQTLCDIGEDTIYVCETCNVAVNKEISAEQTVCPECGNANLVARQAIEVGNIFKLRTRFSEAFGFSYVDADGERRPVEMGCYGIGPSRLLGTLVEVFHDDRGIIWPENVAPFRVHVVGLDMDNPEVAAKAKALYGRIQAQGVEALFDDRVGVTVGEKLADADLIGLPWRFIVSKRTGDQVECKRRDSSEVELMSSDAVLDKLS